MIPSDSPSTLTVTDIVRRLDRIEALLDRFSRTAPSQFAYSVDEFAALVGLAPFTVREHCRLGRLNATKKLSGRGKHLGWTISREELLRYQREGLLPVTDVYRRRTPIRTDK